MTKVANVFFKENKEDEYMKSKAAYTNKWLNRNRHLWEEKVVSGVKIIILKSKSTPKIVIERVKRINESRRNKSEYILLGNLLDPLFNDKTVKYLN